MKQFLSAEDIAEVLRDEGDTSISGRTVHYYAEQRLLPPPEYHGARPRYSEAHLAAMRRVRELKRKGHSLETIGALVGTHVPPAPQPPDAPHERPLPVVPVPLPHPMQHLETISSSNMRTLVVGPGLTLTAAGWDDAALNQIVRAITDAIKTTSRADARERDDHGTSA